MMAPLQEFLCPTKFCPFIAWDVSDAESILQWILADNEMRFFNP
jgi:hypothetical protein